MCLHFFVFFFFMLSFPVLQPSVAPQTHLTRSEPHFQTIPFCTPASTDLLPHAHTYTRSEGWGGDWREYGYVQCSPGRPVFGEDLLSSSGPPTPFRALPTTSSSPPPFSPFKPCSRQSSSSETDLSLTPKTGKDTLPPPTCSIPIHSSSTSLWCYICSVFCRLFLSIILACMSFSLYYRWLLVIWVWFCPLFSLAWPVCSCTIGRFFWMLCAVLTTRQVSERALSPVVMALNWSTVSHEGLLLI